MAGNTVWCTTTVLPVDQCHTHDEEHGSVVSPLGPDDEPHSNGTLVLVWAGNYRWQEVWVASGANIGNWYCLGGEFGRPQVWDPPKVDSWVHPRPADPPRPRGTIPLHPDWSFVLTRGPVYLLSYNDVEAYRVGWRNGRRRLHEEIEALAEDDSGAY